ncbi:MAG TPA: DNA-processing protein DprA [Actinomycetota bacterium]|nr:DNA-processing protein DprA [Actinomycetota bacterium]
MPADAPAAPAAEVAAPIRRPGAWPPAFVASQADRDALVVLAHLEGMPPAELHSLAWREGAASACLAAVTRGASATPGDRRIAAAVDPGAVRSALARIGARVVTPADPEYPERLLHLPDPPACLFVRGRRLAVGGESGPAVGIVGARASSAYGREVAAEIAAGVASAGVAVVSGAARGIDGCAHRGALRAGGPTVAVLGSGIDVAYPRANRRLIEEIAAAGTVISEYPPGMPPHQRRFPARNRIVAALARAVLVVEGAPKSGSLITVEFATDLGRDVMAVPGPVTSPLSIVPHELIRDGAALIRSADDVLAVLGLPPEPGRRALGSGPPAADASPDERRLLEAIAGGPTTADAAARTAGLDPARTLAALVSLELSGAIRAVGGRYERAGRGHGPVPDAPEGG